MEIINFYEQVAGKNYSLAKQQIEQRLAETFDKQELDLSQLIYLAAPDTELVDNGNLRFALFELLLFNEEKQQLDIYFTDNEFVYFDYFITYSDDETKASSEVVRFDLSNKNGPVNSLFELATRYRIDPLELIAAVDNLAELIFPENDYLEGIEPDTFYIDVLDDREGEDFFNQTFNGAFLEHHHEIALSLKIMNGDAMELLMQQITFIDADALLAHQILKSAKLARQQLVERNYLYIIGRSSQLAPHDIPRIEKFQEGVVGALKATNKFDFRMGNRFLTYANDWITVTIQRYRQNKIDIIRRPVHLHGALTKIIQFKEDCEADSGHTPTASEIARELNMTLRQVKAAIFTPAVTQSMDAPIVGDDPNGRSLYDTVPADVNEQLEQLIEIEYLILEIVDSIYQRKTDIKERDVFVFARYFRLGRFHSHPKITFEGMSQRYGIKKTTAQKGIKDIQAALAHTDDQTVVDTINTLLN